MGELTPLLNVENVDRSLRFYRDALGFSVEQRSETGGATVWARIRRGEATLMLNTPEHEVRSADRRARASYIDVVLYLFVDNARALREGLVREGIEAGALEAQDYGVDEFLVRDPDGYELAIAARRAA
jgi:uncharacterized glyoxalase superfamily protein PhnB